MEITGRTFEIDLTALFGQEKEEEEEPFNRRQLRSGSEVGKSIHHGARSSHRDINLPTTEDEVRRCENLCSLSPSLFLMLRPTCVFVPTLVSGRVLDRVGVCGHHLLRVLLALFSQVRVSQWAPKEAASRTTKHQQQYAQRCQQQQRRPTVVNQQDLQRLSLRSGCNRCCWNCE